MGTALLGLFGDLLTLALALLLVPTLLLLMQVVAAMSASCRDRNSPSIPTALGRPKLAVLMPAHNESSGISAVVQSILMQLGARDRLLVVADNCTDDTAALAKRAGAEVVERNDPQRRGKGYALDYGVRHLSLDPPAVLVIIDADCTLGPSCLNLLADACEKAQRPVQALDLMRAPPGAGLNVRMAEFAWVVKNLVRPLGFRRLGLPCQLLGTGMAFPWDLIRVANLASGSIVEDLELGLDLAATGVLPMFCPAAAVWSSFPVERVGLAAQRTRWEHGHLSAIGRRAPRLLWRALTHGQLSLVALVLDLCIPPLAFLAILLALSLIAAVLPLLVDNFLPLLLAIGTTVLFALAILLAWWRFGRQIVTLRELLSVPGYVLAKVPLYAKFFRVRQAEWVRTERDQGGRD